MTVGVGVVAPVCAMTRSLVQRARWSSRLDMASRSLLAICRIFFAPMLVVALVGCAQPERVSTPEGRAWGGRLALQVNGQASQSFSAMFELRGNAQAGELVLLSPFGTQLAQLVWADGTATLESGQQTRTSHSLDALLEDVTGTQIPVAALFSWLQGDQVTAVGWEADLSGVTNGKLVARRTIPTPEATLRIALSR